MDQSNETVSATNNLLNEIMESKLDPNHFLQSISNKIANASIVPATEVETTYGISGQSQKRRNLSYYNPPMQSKTFIDMFVKELDELATAKVVYKHLLTSEPTFDTALVDTDYWLFRLPNGNKKLVESSVENTEEGEKIVEKEKNIEVTMNDNILTVRFHKNQPIFQVYTKAALKGLAIRNTRAIDKWLEEFKFAKKVWQDNTNSYKYRGQDIDLGENFSYEEHQ